MLNGQLALVTGASRGIGQAIALELGKAGAIVVGTATTADGAAKIGAYLADAGIKGKGAALEVRDPPRLTRWSRRSKGNSVPRHHPREQRRHHPRQPRHAHEG